MQHLILRAQMSWFHWNNNRHVLDVHYALVAQQNSWHRLIPPPADDKLSTIANRVLDQVFHHFLHTLSSSQTPQDLPVITLYTVTVNWSIQAQIWLSYLHHDFKSVQGGGAGPWNSTSSSTCNQVPPPHPSQLFLYSELIRHHQVLTHIEYLSGRDVNYY